MSVLALSSTYRLYFLLLPSAQEGEIERHKHDIDTMLDALSKLRDGTKGPTTDRRLLEDLASLAQIVEDKKEGTEEKKSK